MIIYKGIINEGVEDQIDEYCDAMAQLQTAVNFFKQTSDNSPELKRVTALYDIGKKKIVEYYKRLLTTHSTQTPPKKLENILAENSKESNRIELVRTRFDKSVVKIIFLAELVHRNEPPS